MTSGMLLQALIEQREGSIELLVTRQRVRFSHRFRYGFRSFLFLQLVTGDSQQFSDVRLAGESYRRFFQNFGGRAGSAVVEQTLCVTDEFLNLGNLPLALESRFRLTPQRL